MMQKRRKKKTDFVFTSFMTNRICFPYFNTKETEKGEREKKADSEFYKNEKNKEKKE